MSSTQAQKLRNDPRYLQAKEELLKAILNHSETLTQVKPSNLSLKESYGEWIRQFSKQRGRDLYFPFLGSGMGNGPLVELADGSIKYDLITGIGINFFGHTHPELIKPAIDALASDIMQGNLEPGIEMATLLEAILKKTGTEKGCRIKHGWLTTCGTMANEIALKIVRQKKSPKTKVIAFKDCFAGRSTAMQEITDNPKYREGQPTYGEVSYLSFYEKKLGLEGSIERAVNELNKTLVNPNDHSFTALMIELVQGEGGFHFAPREFYVQVFEAAKKAGLAIWIDEIQTFGRTGELFAYQKFNLEPWVDVVTIAKMFQASIVLFTEEFNPKPGLVAGTFSGSTIQLRTALKTLELLEEQKFLGPTGKISKFESLFLSHFKRLSEGSLKGLISEYRVLGGMVAFQPFQGKMDQVKAVLMRLFDQGVIAFYCGHDPYLIRLLPPLGVMTEKQIEEIFLIIEEAILFVKGQS